MSPPSWIPMPMPGKSHACSTISLMGLMAARECAATRTSRAASINFSVSNVKPSLTTSRPRPLKSGREPLSSPSRSRFHLRWELALNEQDEAGSDTMTKLEALPPPMLPSPAFHFNKKGPLRSTPNAAEELHARLTQVEAQIVKKQGKADRRSASLQALLKERAELQARLAAQEKGP